MTPTTHTTQAAAKRCADLANAVHECFKPADFVESFPDRTAFRREVESKDAMIREVLAKLDDLENLSPMDAIRIGWVEDKLRADLLPTEPQPQMLYQEFVTETVRENGHLTTAEHHMVRYVFDWIAKRQEKEA